MAINATDKVLARPRVFLTGAGGQGTLTATRLLGQAAMIAGVPVLVGEIHGMAQRGGIVESCVLLGGWQAPRIAPGEADMLIGFEALETLRALPYLKPGGIVFSSTEAMPPLSVTLGQAAYPDMEEISAACAKSASAVIIIPSAELGQQAGNARAANTALLGAVCASGYLPIGINDLRLAIARHLPEKLQAINLEAMRLGADFIQNAL